MRALCGIYKYTTAYATRKHSEFCRINCYAEKKLLWIKMSILSKLNTIPLYHPIFEAVKNNNITELNRILPDVVSPKILLTAVSVAVLNNKMDMFKALIQWLPGVKLNEALSVASELGFKEFVDALIPRTEPKYHSKALSKAAGKGYVECVKQLLAHSNPKGRNSKALTKAAKGGHLDVVQLLLPISDLEQNHNHALRAAATYGRMECFNLLRPLCDPNCTDKTILFSGLRGGHVHMIEHLVQIYDPTIDEDFALSLAVRTQNIDVVHMLLTVCNPKSKHSNALQLASINNCDDIFDLLYPLSSPQDALHHLSGPNKLKHQNQLQTRMNEKLKEVLLQETSGSELIRKSKI